MTTYVTGYGGDTRDRAQLEQWDQWQGLDDEFARRFLALMDASIVAGSPVGVGGTIRTTDGQRRLFLSRHEETMWPFGCCQYEGKRWKLRKGQAHAAPPGRSYHEPTTQRGECLAIDAVGDLRWLADHCAAYGLRQFADVNNEPWHVQPSDIPSGRSSYRPTKHEPLKRWPLPDGAPPPAPTRVLAPVPTLAQGRRNDAAQVRHLQHLCNFWGWRDANGRKVLVDGQYGPKTAQAVMAMQTALQVPSNGTYGASTATALQAFLDAMAGQR